MRVRFTTAALADLKAIDEYLRRESPAAALAVLLVIERRVALLESFPLMAPMTEVVGVRELSITRYPYKVYYEVVAEEVWILHIRHAHRAPWRGTD